MARGKTGRMNRWPEKEVEGSHRIRIYKKKRARRERKETFIMCASR